MTTFKAPRLYKYAVTLFFGIFLTVTVTMAVAQPDYDDWSAPINLSRSGAAIDPLLVVDSSSVLHVLWLETAINRFVYSRGRDDQWQRPLPVELPFATLRYEEEVREGAVAPLFIPKLIADGNGRIHAFWLDDEQTLFHSQVAATQFDNFESWSVRQAVADSVLEMAATVDGSNRVHLTTIRFLDTSTAPAGIYYQSADGGETQTWTGARNLYDSAYFRALSAEQANLQIATTDNGRVLVGWDVPSLEQLFVTASANQGQTWREPIQVDRRQEDDSSSAVGPSKLRLAADGDVFHLLWQAGHNGSSCDLYHQRSVDGGTSWQESTTLENVVGCSENMQWLSTASLLLLMTSSSNGLGLTAWNAAESRWSERQPQSTSLVSFNDPETFRTVDFGCQQVTLTGNSDFIVVGCDESETGEDIWLQQRPLGELAEWFAAPPIWSESVPITNLSGEVTFLASVADEDGRVHALWTQRDARAIQYARWENERWSSAAPVITSPGGNAAHPAVTLGSNGRLLAVWPESQTGLLYFSQADVARASSAAEWSKPRLLPAARPGVGAAAIVDNLGGRNFVAYALPVNEGRGIYVTQSSDGEDWTEPLLAVDAAAAGWSQVDNPRLAVTNYEHLHLLWTRGNVIGDGDRQRLYYARSDDGGQSWSEPAEVKSGTQQAAPVIWSQIVGLGERVVHRVWQTEDNGRFTVWHQMSVDDGLTWSRAGSVSGGLVNNAESGPVALTVDGNGRLYLLQTAAGSLQQWVWQDERWQAGESAELIANAAPSALAAARVPNGSLAVIYAASHDEAAANGLYFTTGAVNFAPATAPTLPTLTPTPIPTPLPTATPPPDLQPTVVFPTTREDDISAQLGLPSGTTFLIFLGAIPALIIVGAGFFMGLKRVRR